jgi:CheY-like chemotaxis protein
MRVLVVDDSGFSRSVIAGLFAQAKPLCDVAEAANAEQALAMVDKAGPFSLITVDVHMPGIDGFELVRQLKERKVRAHISIISANVQESAKARAAELGVGFLAKPVNLSKVNALLQEFGL